MMLQEEWGELITEPPVTLTPQKETQLLSQYAFLVNRAAAHMRTQVGVIVDNDDIYQISRKCQFLGCESKLNNFDRWLIIKHTEKKLDPPPKKGFFFN